MKKVIIITGIVSLILSACTNSKLATYSDDVYANPSEERLEKARLAAEKKKKQEEEAKKEAEERAAELAAQKAKDDANPAYKYSDYDKDDYYDYQYASRIRRFNNPVYGVGYYDNYYTNSYWYSGNPAMYGTSIYSSYNYWGPSYSNYNCFPSSYFGVGFNWGYPSYGYNNYNPYYGWGDPYANAYWAGYNNGYNNGFYNGYYGYPYGGGWGYNGYNNWGYYNQFDVNSNYNKPTNAPRGSHDGGNTGRRTNPSNYTDGLVQKYVQEVQVAQANTQKFADVRKMKETGNYNNPSTATFENFTVNPDYNPKNTNVNSGNNNEATLNNGNSGTYTNPKNTSINSGNSEATFNNGNSGTYTNPKSTINNNNTNEAQFNNYTPPKNTEPVRPIKNTNQNTNPKGNVFDAGTPTFNGGNNNPKPSGNSPSGNSPRGGGDSGGGKKPR